jgi:hypothetical protein
MENSTESTVLTNEEKDKIIKEVYNNDKKGYGSIKDTYQQVNKINRQITIKNVKTWMDKQSTRQTQFVYKQGFNSFISKGPLFELEMDLIDMGERSREKNNNFRYALVAIDNFTKYAWAIPMEYKIPSSIIPAFKQILTKIGTPKQLYSDDEGSFNSKEMVQLLNEKKIKHIITTFAQGVERFNRTLKTATILKMRAMGQEEEYSWVSQLENTLNKYNNSEHRTIKMSPNEAKKKGNTQLVHFNIFDKAQRKRVYPDLEVGDKVRIKVKPRTIAKGYDLKWSKEVFKVTFIKGADYMINDTVKKRIYLRPELQKITD